MGGGPAPKVATKLKCPIRLEIQPDFLLKPGFVFNSENSIGAACNMIRLPGVLRDANP